MKKTYLKSRVISFKSLLTIVVILSVIVYGCRKDFGNHGKTQSADVLADHGINLTLLQNNYNSSVKNNLKALSISQQDLSRIIGTENVDWTTYTLYNNPDSSQTIEFDMPDDRTLIVPGGIAVNDSSKYHSKTSAVFFIRKDTVSFGFFMKTTEDGTGAGYQPVLSQLHYDHIPVGFTGDVLYFTFGKNFINGYSWNNGLIAKAISLTANTASNQPQINKVNHVKTDALVLTNCVVITYDFYNLTIANGEITHADYMYSIIITKCDISDDGTGSGGTVPGGGVSGGGGGGTSTPPTPPRCPPGVAVQAVKGAVIINVLEGGGGSGGGTPTPCTIVVPPTPPTITNDVKNPCLKSMVNATIVSGIGNKINSLINSVFGSSTKMNLTFIDVNTLPSFADGFTDANGGIVNGQLNVTVQLDLNHLPNYSQEYIARVIMHEALHAFLTANGTADQLQHENMAISYVTQMAASLQQMFPGLSDPDAKNLALGGLQFTETFNNTIKNNLGLSGSFDSTNLAYSLGSLGKRCNI